jgi:hypothetical protein
MPAAKPPAPFRITAGGSAATIAAAEGAGGKLGTFTGRAYTGVPMRPEGWGTPIVVDLDGVEVPDDQHRPVLRQHDHLQIVGHTGAVTVTPGEAGGIDIAGVFSGEKQHTDKVTVPAKNGFKWQLSIGADPVATEYLEHGETATVNGREVTGPLTISRQTRLGEVSFVPLGADGNTSATVTASNRKGRGSMYKGMLKAAKIGGDVRAAKFSDEDIEKMDEKEAKAALQKCMKAEEDDDKKVDADDDDDADDTDLDDDKKVDADDDDKKVDADDDPPPPKAKAKAKASGRRPARQSIRAAFEAEMGDVRKAAAREIRRQDAIRARCAKHKVDAVTIDGAKVNLAAHAIEAGWTADKVELVALRSARPGPDVGSPLVYSTNRPELNDAVLEAAVFQAAQHEFKLFDAEFYDRPNSVRGPLPARYKRQLMGELTARYPDQVMQAAHTLFKGRVGLQQLLVAAAARNGYRGSEVIRGDDDLAGVAHYSSIRADGASTASIANVLANVMNKFLGQGYLFVERAWAEIAGIKPVKDFKATKSINLFGDFEYQDVGPSGELKNAALQDQAFANQASTSGRIITISRTQIINDDLGALTTVPLLLGRGAGLKLNKAFWTKFLNPGNDEGGSTAFWAAVHTIANQQAAANYISGGTTNLSSTSLQTAKQTFDKQIDPMGYPLGVEARVLLYPVELDQVAWELLNSSFIVAGGGSSTNRQPSNNRWVGKYKPVMSRYLSNSAFTGYSTTGWYLLAEPGEIPTVEVCFLNGQEMPTVTMAGPDFQFNILGISTRAILDSGVSMQNFRGGVKSAGA